MNDIKNISFAEFKTLVNSGQDFQIIDVRLLSDKKLPYNNTTRIPFNKINDSIEKIDRNKKVIVVCDNGVNSFFAVQLLEQFHGFTNLYNLKGGISEFLDL